MEDAGFWKMQISDVINFFILLATVVAIVYGPIKAVQISREHEKVNAAFRQKRDILSALMRTRKNYMHPEHVGALNLVQLEFVENHKVLDQFKLYIENLADPLPVPGNELDNFLERRRNLFIDLLFEIGVVMELKLDRADLDRLAYIPFGWATDDAQQRELRHAFLELLQAKRPLPIIPFQPSGGPATSSPYPAPPT